MEFKFYPKNMVKILPLGVDGVVTSVWFDSGGIQYKVRYFWQGRMEEVYFYDVELENK